MHIEGQGFLKFHQTLIVGIRCLETKINSNLLDAGFRSDCIRLSGFTKSIMILRML